MTTIIIDGEVIILEGVAEAEYWAKLPSSDKDDELSAEEALDIITGGYAE